MSICAFAFGREKHIQIKFIELSLHGNPADAVWDAVGHHHHPGQSCIRISITFPVFLGSLLIGVGPVVNLILNEFAGVECSKRRARQIQIVHGGDGQERFIASIAAIILVQILTVVAVLVLLLKQFLGVFLPGTEVVLVEDHQVPVGCMYPFIFCLDAAGLLVHSQIVLKGAKADNGAGLICRFIGQLCIPADELPAFKINVTVQVLLPGTDHRRLEGQNQNPFESHPLCKLIGCKGFAEPHFAVPQKFRVAGCVLCISALKVGRCFVHGFLLLRAHGKTVDSILYIGSTISHCQHCCADIIHGTAEPFTTYAGNMLSLQNTVNIMIGKGRTVRVHGTFPKNNPIRYAAIRPLGRILLGNPFIYINGSIPNLQKPFVLGIGILIGVYHWVSFGALREEFSCHRHHRLLP